MIPKLVLDARFLGYAQHGGFDETRWIDRDVSEVNIIETWQWLLAKCLFIAGAGIAFAIPPRVDSPMEYNMIAGQLFVSFWNIALDNFPEGTFRHRRLSPDEAKSLVSEARELGVLFGASQNDLLAPYKEREKANQKALCQTLEEHFGITLSLGDFMIEDEEDGKPGYMTRPLQLAEIRGASRLLVVNCHYTMSQGPGLEFDVYPPSVTFHLFEAIGSGDAT